MNSMNYFSAKFSSYRCFVFDFDGVVADTVSLKASAFSEALSNFCNINRELAEAFFVREQGLTRQQKFLKLAGHKNAVLKEFDERFDQAYRELFPLISINKEIMVFCCELKRKENCPFINTRASKREVLDILNFFGVDIFREENIFDNFASKVINLGKIAEKTNVDKKKIMFFGDSESDRNAANDFGCGFELVNCFDKE